MRVNYRTWETEYDEHDRITRRAGSAVNTYMDNGQASVSFCVPSPNIGNHVSQLIHEMLEGHTPHELHSLAQHIQTVAFYAALETPPYPGVSEDDEDEGDGYAGRAEPHADLQRCD